MLVKPWFTNQVVVVYKRPMPRLLASILALILMAAPALAQDRGTLEKKELPPIANPSDPKVAAKELFGRKAQPVPLQARAIGFYSKGCIAGAKALPINGETWQVMRLSRNRNWGHPQLIALLEKLSKKSTKVAGWNGLLVGDISQPRGGPMLTGHASHQVGLDADIWLTPMPKRELSRLEREEMSATMMVAKSRTDIDPEVWTAGHGAVIRAAAEEPNVERIFVNAAIKKALCRDTNGSRAWLNKVRPMWGHDYHFHVRIKCPDGEADCKPQDPVPASEGCGSDLDWWFQESILFPKPPVTPPKPKPPMTLADLPAACRQIVMQP
jgi:penicillin-insensitive murein DD-endopeptidase